MDAMENDKKQNKSKGFIIIIALLVLIIIGLGGYIVYTNLEGNNPNPKETEKENTEEAVEKELTDDNIKADLNKKIQYLTNESSEGRTNDYSFRNGTISDFGDVFHNLDDDLKLYIVLDYLYHEDKFQDLASENESDPMISEYVQIFGAKYVKQITGGEVKKAYNNFYGTDKVDFTVLKSRLCFNYIYESSKDIFYKESPNCGGTSGAQVYSYKNKYTIKGDTVYVYENYGLLGSTSDDGKLTVFKDLEKAAEYKTGLSSEEESSFRINESNYSEFSEYKYTFKKNEDGSYYFVSLDKVK